MKKYFVVGNKSSQSLSPMIFNYWFKKYKIKAEYRYLELNNKNFSKEIHKTLTNNETGGLNITIPFKKKIIKHIDRLDTHSKKINAVNCVSKKTKIIGANTDWQGYLNTLPKINKNFKQKNILIIGYGGAGIAIHYGLISSGFENIFVINRSKKKLNFKKKACFTESFKKIDYYLKNVDVIINTTPTNPIIESKKNLVNKKTLLSDIVYKPKETNFLKSFPKNKKIYGISMLIHQAVLSFEIWFGFKPKLDKELMRMLNKQI